MKRGTRTLLWVLLVIGLAGIGAATVVSLRSNHTTVEAVQYHCPMHPTYVSEKPGDCPICGMRLVPVESTRGGTPAVADTSDSAVGKTSASASAAPDSLAYTCPMHPEVHSASPGSCPTCGMDLVPSKPKAAAPAAAQYVCPMHPEVVSDKAERCPKCGMALEKKVVKAAPATTSQGRLLYYRNPMNPAVHSPTPAKDEMGMDYVPVYEDVGQARSTVPGLAVVRTNAEGMRQAGVQVTAARRGELGRRIRTVGTITADDARVRQVSLKSAGWVETLHVATSGQFVRQGDPLLSLYSPDLLAGQEEFLQAVKAARSAGTGDAQLGTAALVQAARRRLQLLDVPASLIQELDQGGAAQRTVTLRSPVSGYVMAKQVVQGQRIEAGEALFTVTDLSRVWVEAAFSESEAALVRVGQSLAFEQPDQPGLRLSGRVTQILPALDPDSRTLRVRASLDNPAQALKPGMYVDVETEVAPRAGLLIPDSAVLDTGLRQVVYVETEPGTFAPREIRTGQRGGGQALVLTGLREGERVAIAGNFLLDSEARIRGSLEAQAN
ncbi:MAG: efflux RND transporter periplasmic adaptor subunit [Candidatus Delongbacteria bacterium]